MKGIAERGVTRVSADAGPSAAEKDRVAVEEPLEICLSGDPLAVTLRTPGDDAKLAVGFLFSEGIIRSIADVGTVVHCGRPGEEGYGNVLDVTPAPGVNLDVEKTQAARRGTLTTSACGVCSRRSVDDLLTHCGVVSSEHTVALEIVRRSTDHLRSIQRAFAQTGGTHAALVLDDEGNVLAGFEDVGRHNAVDKVVGGLLYQGIVSRAPVDPLAPPVGLPRAAVLAVSGRANFEIVQKATVARIPVVASVSAASSMAVDLAIQSGITLATFVRGGGFNLYSHPERVR